MENSRRLKICPRDFSTLFVYFWYQDFPLERDGRMYANTSDWTSHISFVFRKVGSLLGLYTHFESGGKKFDGVLRDRNGKGLIFAEWEYQSPAENLDINEISKLRDMEENPDFCFLLTYMPARIDKDPSFNADEILDGIGKKWRENENKKTLLLGLITFDGTDKKLASRRDFKELQFHLFEDGEKREMIQNKPALPWNVGGSRWWKSLEDSTSDNS